MKIEYLSSRESALFHSLISQQDQTSEVVGAIMAWLESDSDYDSVTVSFDETDCLRIAVLESPFVIVVDEDTQTLELYVEERDSQELALEGEYDFDEDGAETLADVICSRILEDDYDS